MNNKAVDKRTSDRYVEKGVLKRADVDAYLKALPDEANNATWVQMDLEETEITSRGTNGTGTQDPGQSEGT